MNCIKIERSLVEVFITRKETGTIVMIGRSLNEVQEYFRNIRPDWTVQKFLEEVGRYENAKFESLRTDEQKLIATLSFKTKEELCAFLNKYGSYN